MFQCLIYRVDLAPSRDTDYIYRDKDAEIGSQVFCAIVEIVVWMKYNRHTP